LAGAWTDVLNSVHPLFYLSLFLLSGYAGGFIAGRLGLPRISGYLGMGMILSPSLLGVFSEDLLAGPSTLITDLALAVIAFSIGSALKLDRLRRIGRPILFILTWEAAAVFGAVTGASGWYLSAVHPMGISTEVAWATAILIGAVSAPTAPAPILAVVHEYKAKGPLTSTLLGVVTLDDGITIFFFSIAAALARRLVGSEPTLTAQLFKEPLLEISLSMGIGILGGLVLKMVSPTLNNRESILVMGLGAVFLVAGSSSSMGASPLMAAMVLGFVTVNFVRHPDQWFDEVERLEEPLFAMFFVMAGAHLQIQVLARAGLLAVIVVMVRTAAKFLGAYAGARMGGAPDNIRHLIPIGLLPQAGISLGLVIVASSVLGDGPPGEIIVNVVLASVIINELISPVLVHFALARAGEIPGPGNSRGILE